MDHHPKAVPVPRGCGTRKQGGCYAECGSGPGGRPLEDFLICPPQKINPAELGVRPIGVRLVEHQGVWHILDWVGSEHYPNVADMLEEIRRFGLSRRLPSTLDFGKLTEHSRILLIHARAWIENFGAYADHWAAGRYNRCPKHIESHDLPDAPMMCAGGYWQDVEWGAATADPRVVRRGMPSFEYVAARRPAHITPLYVPAIFASFPIHRLVVIKGRNGEHEATQAKASRAGLPVELEDR